VPPKPRPSAPPTAPVLDFAFFLLATRPIVKGEQIRTY
jgi:hypothetical protein